MNDAALTLTGTTQVTADLSYACFGQPTITDASAVTVDKANTLYIKGAPVAAGSVTITASRSLKVAAGISEFGGQVIFPDGAVAAPGIRTTTEAHGLYRVDATTLGVSVAGTLACKMTSSGILFPAAGYSGSTAGAQITFYQGSAANNGFGMDNASYNKTSGSQYVFGVLAMNFNPTSGAAVQSLFGGTYTVNQTSSSTGTVNGIFINATETAVLGTHNLMDLQVGSAPKFKVTNAGLAISAADQIRIATSKTPSSSGDTGVVGSICWDASYIYVCTATNTWERAAIATW